MNSEDAKKEFDKIFNKAYEEQSPNFDMYVNVAFVGKVSAGKSSLINAILGCTRENPIAKVGAKSGVTTKVTAYKLDEQVLIVDCPGLDDVRKENSAVTKDFLDSIDLGVFVITGSADASQKANFDDLKKNSKKTIVVLNKIDVWDDLNESAYADVVQQWKIVLGVDEIFGTCTKGFDPEMRQSAPMDIRGVEEVQKELFDFLNSEGKALLLARHLKSKERFAITIIGTAIVAVAGEAFIPGSAAYITATQVVAITSLNYLYKGEILSKSSALALLPTFAGESLGTTAFLWAKSFLPPTLVLDVAAAGIAVVITFAMLAAVKWMFENDYSLDENDILKKVFSNFKKSGAELKKIKIEDLKDKTSLFSLLERLLGKRSDFMP